MKDSIKIQALKSFFSLFEANVLISNKQENDDVFQGVLNWEGEEDTQDFKWSNIFNEKALFLLKDICDFIRNNRLNDNDKILVSEVSLREKLKKSGWNSSKIEKAIECLMAINVKMVDEGEETDAFLMHF